MKINTYTLAIIFFLSLFISLSIYNLSYPALYYDEMLFVNASLGGTEDFFIYKKFFDIPIYLMPYIGALKSWIYFPIFKFLDVSLLSVSGSVS